MKHIKPFGYVKLNHSSSLILIRQLVTHPSAHLQFIKSRARSLKIPLHVINLSYLMLSYRQSDPSYRPLIQLLKSLSGIRLMEGKGKGKGRNTGDGMGEGWQGLLCIDRGT